MSVTTLGVFLIIGFFVYAPLLFKAPLTQIVNAMLCATNVSAYPDFIAARTPDVVRDALESVRRGYL
jgi:hypothetical protein